MSNALQAQLSEIASEIRNSNSAPVPPPVQSNRPGPADPVRIPPNPSAERADPIEHEPEVPEPETVEESEDAVTPDTESLEIKDLKGLVEAIDVEPEFLYGLEVPMGDGEPPVKLGELKDALTASRREARALQERLAREKELPPPTGPDISRWSEQMIQAQGLMTAIQQQFDATDWNNPDADKGELAYHKQQLVDAYTHARRYFDQAQAQQHQQLEQAFSGYRDAEMDKLMKAVPDWSNAERAQADKRAIQTVIGEYGFTDQDLKSVIDHRIVLLLRDFANLKQAQVKTQESVKKIQKAPKVLGTRGRKLTQTENVDRLIQQARSSNTRNRQKAEIAAVKAILGGYDGSQSIRSG